MQTVQSKNKDVSVQNILTFESPLKELLDFRLVFFLDEVGHKVLPNDVALFPPDDFFHGHVPLGDLFLPLWDKEGNSGTKMNVSRDIPVQNMQSIGIYRYKNISW